MSLPGALQVPIVRLPPNWRTVHVALLAVLWVLLWVLLTLVEIAGYMHDPRVPLWQPIVLVTVPTALITAWVTWEIRSTRYERPAIDSPARWFRHHLLRLPLLIVAGIVLMYGLRSLIFSLAGAHYGHLVWHVAIPWEAVKISVLYCLWLGLIFGALTLAKWREESERVLSVQKALAEAQLAQLQAQLRPHFIFNALNTVSALMHTDVARADRVLAQLGDLLRASLRANRREDVSLEDELELLKRYVSIMHERFDGRVNVVWDVADGTLSARLPAMLLQPLLENAFKHGIERSSQPETITVRAARVGETLRIDIHNTGSHMTDGEPAGVGLRNCRERLYLLYGSQASLILTNADNGGVLARVTVPWQEPAP